MTDIAARPSIAKIMTTEALMVDLDRVQAQLTYLGAFESESGEPGSVSGAAPAHLIETWNTLVAEAERRGLTG